MVFLKKLNKKEIEIVMKKLNKLYPDARPELNFSNSFELLIATILSAQCTDVRVNKVTEILFNDYKTPEEFLSMDINTLSEYIHSCGFYNSKSKNILETCKILVEKYDSIVPNNMEDLTKLPGVGRKTANVVMSCAFGIPAIAVDTHVFRVTNRIGIVNETDVLSTEESLMKVLKKDTWSIAHHLFIFHGRRLCTSRSPKCNDCIINTECKYYKANFVKS